MDYDLYSNIWSLQQFFLAPNSCYLEKTWGEFIKVRPRAASRHQRRADGHSGAGCIRRDQAGAGVGAVGLCTCVVRAERRSVTGAADAMYFPKYLTSATLLALETKDPAFQRQARLPLSRPHDDRAQVLVQLLVLLDYLKADVKFKAFASQCSV